MGNKHSKNEKIPKGTTLKVISEKYGIDKIKGIQDWVKWTAGRKDPFPLTGSLDPKILNTVSAVLTEGKGGCPRKSEKHWRALAAWLMESQAETEHKRLGLEGTVNQRKTQDEERQGKLKQALEQLAEVKTQGEDKQEKLEQARA